MIPEISKVKGIHPGAILRREIKSRGLKNKEFADLIHEYAQTISAVLNEKRSINPNLSIKLGMRLGVDSDYFMLLQASYDVKMAQNKLSDQETPNLKSIRKILFWDTDFNKIDWINNKRAVIKRVFERGNEKEIEEIINFYGKDIVKGELENTSNNFLPSFEYNVNKYIGV
jgi:addiction module HigA family antidote